MSLKKICLYLFCITGTSLSTLSFANQDFLSMQNYQIIVNNRILAKVQGQTISVLDVMKEMEVFLNHHHPEIRENITAKYQYFTSQWRKTLADMIDNELILADAEAKKITATEGDIRETIQERFGPNVMVTLDKLGITYEEARKMVRSDLIVRKMRWFKVSSKALQAVNPKDVRLAFQNHIMQNPPVEEWEYKVISVRNQSEQLGAAVAKIAHNLLHSQKATTENLKESMQEQIEIDPSSVVTVSEEFHATDKNISEAHKAVLSQMQPETYSSPVMQISRADNSFVHRIFYLKKHTKKEPPSFNQISSRLENGLINSLIVKESNGYISKLRKYYGFDEQSLKESIPENFEPFTIRTAS